MRFPVYLVHAGQADLVELAFVHAEVRLAHDVWPVRRWEGHVEKERLVLVLVHKRNGIISYTSGDGLLLGKRLGKIDEPLQQLVSQTGFRAAGGEEVPHSLIGGAQAPGLILLALPPGAVFHEFIKPLLRVAFLERVILARKTDLVAGFFERLNEGELLGSNLALLVVVKAFIVRRVSTREKARATGTAQHRARECIFKARAFIRQRVDVWRLHYLVTVTAE